MSKLVLLAAENSRAKCYVQNLARENIPISEIVVLSDKRGLRPENNNFDKSFWDNTKQSQIARVSGFKSFFDQKESLTNTARKFDLKITNMPNVTVNSPSLKSYLMSKNIDDLLYCGPGGVIVPKEILSTCNRVLHVHLGKLPAFRGSTTLYYSVLAGEKVGGSLIQMNAEIDSGPTLFFRDFAVSDLPIDLDHVLDPIIRTEVLLAYLQSERGLRSQAEKNSLEAQSEGEAAFHIIHPILKHLAVKKLRGRW